MNKLADIVPLIYRKHSLQSFSGLRFRMLVKGACHLLVYVAVRELWRPLKSLLWSSTTGESL